MGFGLLFIGYFIATVAGLAFPEIAGFTGFAVICLALMSLAEYDSRFGYTLIPAVPIALVSLVLTAEVLLGYFYIPVPSFITWTAEHSDVILNSLKLIFHCMLCISIHGIAKDTGADKLCFPAMRNMFLYCVCYLVDVLSFTLKGALAYLLPIATLVYLLTVILNHVMIFSAYMRICDENDVDMEIKKTNIAWFDKLVEKKASMEQKAADDTKEYFQARYNRKMQEKAKRGSAPKYNHKKKKK